MDTVLKHSLVATFTLICAAPSHAQLLDEHFTYSDGGITAVSGGNWVTYGPDATSLNISSGAAIINQGDTTLGREDVSRAIGATFSAGGPNTVAYASFDASWSALPSNANGSYFAVFNISPTSNTSFFGRVGADLSGAAAGKFRIAVANAAWSEANSTEFVQDLDLNTTYHVVVRYDLSVGQTTLWINPTSQASTSVTATDVVASQLDFNAFSLREGRSSVTGAPGIIRIDELKIGTTFAQVGPVPEPEEYAAMFAGGLVAFAMLRRRSHGAK